MISVSTFQVQSLYFHMTFRRIGNDLGFFKFNVMVCLRWCLFCHCRGRYPIIWPKQQLAFCSLLPVLTNNFVVFVVCIHSRRCILFDRCLTLRRDPYCRWLISGIIELFWLVGPDHLEYDLEATGNSDDPISKSMQ